MRSNIQSLLQHFSSEETSINFLVPSRSIWESRDFVETNNDPGGGFRKLMRLGQTIRDEARKFQIDVLDKHIADLFECIDQTQSETKGYTEKRGAEHALRTVTEPE